MPHRNFPFSNNGKEIYKLPSCKLKRIESWYLLTGPQWWADIKKDLKLLTRRCQMPSILHCMFPQTSVGAVGNRSTRFHIFLDCPKLKDFWNMVEHTVKELPGVSFEKNPAEYLLHDTPLFNKSYKKNHCWDTQRLQKHVDQHFGKVQSLQLNLTGWLKLQRFRKWRTSQWQWKNRVRNSGAYRLCIILRILYQVY